MNKTYEETRSLFQVLRKTYDFLAAKRGGWLAFYNAQPVENICYVACGSGFCTSASAAETARVRAGKNAWRAAGGDLFMNFAGYEKALQNSLLVAPSRSGSTSEVVAALKKYRAAKLGRAAVVSLVEGADMCAEGDFVLEMPWAFNAAVCQTSCIQALYMTNLVMAAQLAGDDALLAELDEMIDAGQAFIEKSEGVLKAFAARPWEYPVLLADGEAFGLADEGAMAFAEIAKLQANAYHVLDVRHGPAVLLDEKAVVIVLVGDDNLQVQQALVDDLKRRGAAVVALSASELPLKNCDVYLPFGKKMQGAVAGIPFLYVTQALSVFKALELGLNPDDPGDLTPWIRLDI